LQQKQVLCIAYNLNKEKKINVCQENSPAHFNAKH